jgi:serine/threonine-protein kinase
MARIALVAALLSSTLGTGQEHYLEGRRLLDTRRGDAMRASVGELEAAVRADPAHARAWTALAEAWALLALYSIDDPLVGLPRAREAVGRALELDDSLADAHAVLGLVRYLYEWDFAAAEASFRRALELDAAHAEAAHWYAMMLAATARADESLARLDQALAVEPDSPLLVTKRGTLLTAAGRLDEAAAQLELARERFPEYAFARRESGFLALRRHATSGERADLEAALGHFRRADELAGGDSKARAGVAFALGVLGRREEAEQVVATLVETDDGSSFVSPMIPALAHLGLGLGGREHALDELERAESLRDPGLVYLGIKPGFESLYDEPRFIALARRIGLPSPRLVPAAPRNERP